MFIHLPNVYGCFNAITTELTSYNKKYMAHKAKNIYYLNL